MKQHDNPSEVQEYIIDEPGYGFGPFDPFKSSYQLDGILYDVTIQGFTEQKDDETDNFHYRVTYRNGDEKILSHILRLGFVDQEGKATQHTRILSQLIEERFCQ